MNAFLEAFYYTCHGVQQVLFLVISNLIVKVIAIVIVMTCNALTQPIDCLTKPKRHQFKTMLRTSTIHSEIRCIGLNHRSSMTLSC